MCEGSVEKHLNSITFPELPMEVDEQEVDKIVRLWDVGFTADFGNVRYAWVTSSRTKLRYVNCLGVILAPFSCLYKFLFQIDWLAVAEGR